MKKICSVFFFFFFFFFITFVSMNCSNGVVKILATLS